VVSPAKVNGKEFLFLAALAILTAKFCLLFLADFGTIFLKEFTNNGNITT
jgi:hypothetical protein